MIVYNSEALLNTVEGYFESPSGFLKKVCLKGLRDLIDQQSPDFAIGSQKTLMAVFEMIAGCLPSFHKKFGMSHFSDIDLNKKVFCLSPLVRNSYSPLHSPIFESLDPPYY